MKQSFKLIRSTRLFGICAAVFCVGQLFGGHACAQQNPRTSIQLPVFSVFGGATTVVIPDRGQALLGSVKRSSVGSVSRGVPLLNNVPVAGRLFGNRAIGKSQSASTLSANVQIIDLKAMDEAILEKAKRDRIMKLGGPDQVEALRKKDELKRKAEFIRRNLGRGRSPQ